jgi:hypothetical protein
MNQTISSAAEWPGSSSRSARVDRSARDSAAGQCRSLTASVGQRLAILSDIARRQNPWRYDRPALIAMMGQRPVAPSVWQNRDETPAPAPVRAGQTRRWNNHAGRGSGPAEYPSLAVVCRGLVCLWFSSAAMGDANDGEAGVFCRATSAPCIPAGAKTRCAISVAKSRCATIDPR